MERTETDILIAGGGVAGLAAAAVLGAAGFGVLCVDPVPPATEESAEGADLRTTAVLRPGAELLAEAGVWERLLPAASPLWTMRIVDASGPGGAVRIARDFEAADLAPRPFGWNLPNWLLRRELIGRNAELPGVQLRPGVAVTGLLVRDAVALVALSDRSRAAARLVLAADGRDSAVRRLAGIGARCVRYGQKALVCVVTHAVPHGGVSTEVHRAGGPFTLVPLPDRDGRPASAVVWMERAEEALRLAALPPAALGAAMTERSAGLYGPLALASRVALWPIIAQAAERLTAPRTALVAEAAHVVPPIGAQGLNMSLADIRALRDLALAHRAGLGGPAMLQAYARARRADLALRLAGIDLLNRVSMAGAPPVAALRARGIALLHDIAPLRRAAMRLGLGAGG